MEYRASLTSAEREIARVEARRKKLIEMVLEDELPASEIKSEPIANVARREEQQRKLEMANEPPPLLHPQMADAYRERVSALSQALEQRTAAPRRPRRSGSWSRRSSWNQNGRKHPGHPAQG